MPSASSPSCARSGTRSSRRTARSPDFRERAVAYRAIGQFRFRQKIELLRRGLEDESPACRGSALLSLELLSRDHPGVVNGVRPLLHELVARDDNDAVRRLAIVALRNGSAQRDTIAILTALADDDEQGRELREAAGEGRPAAPPQGRAGALVHSLLAPRVRVRGEVRLAPPAVGDVRVELGRAEVGVAEHLLDAAQVGAALEQVRRERVAEQVRVDASGLEARRVSASRRRIRNAPERVSAPPCALRKSSGRWRRSRYGRPRAR